MAPLRLTSSALLDGRSAPFAEVTSANLAHGPVPIPGAAPRLLAWSGWFGEPSDPGRGPFPRDFRNWTPAGWQALSRACDIMLPHLTAGSVELWLRPHARHVLSDPQSCISFLRGREGQPVRLLLDPAAFLTGSMIERAEDHLDLALGALGRHPQVAAVLLTNIRRVDPDDDDALGPAPLHRGLLDPQLLLRPWRACRRADIPVALLDEEFDAQAMLLDAR